MSKLDYTGQFWQGSLEVPEELLFIRMTDDTFQHHLKQHLERLGIPSQTHSELMAYVQQVEQRQYEAMQDLLVLDWWHECRDLEVRIFRRVSSDLTQYKARSDAEREQALNEIAQMSQELGLYD